MKLKTLVIYALGPVGAALVGLITLPMLAWFYNPEVVGRYGLLNIGISLVSLTFALGLDQAYVREFYNSVNHSKLLKNCIAPAIALLTLFLVILVSCYFLDYSYFINSETKLWLIAYVGLGYFIILNLFTGYYFRMQQNAAMYSLSQFIPKILFLILMLLFVATEVISGFLAVAAAQFMSLVLLSVFLLLSTKEAWLAAFNERFEFSTVKPLLKFGFPLVFSNLIFWALVSMDRLALKLWADLSAVGVFSVAASLALAAGVLQVVFSTIWSPIIYRWEQEGIEKYTSQFNDVFSAMAALVFCCFCLVGIFGWILDFVLPAEYTRVKYILLCCFAYPLFFTLSEITVVGLHLGRKTTFVLLASFTALLVNLTLNFLLTPQYAIAGAAIATAVSFYLIFIFRTELSVKLWRPFPRRKIYLFSSVILALICTQAFSNMDYIYWSAIWSVMLILIIVTTYKQLQQLLLIFRGSKSS